MTMPQQSLGPTPPGPGASVGAPAPSRRPVNVLAVCWWCTVVVTGALVPLTVMVAGAALLSGEEEPQTALGFPALLLATTLSCLLLFVTVVGLPAGLLLTAALRRVRSEVAHVVAFTLVGAVLCAVLVVVMADGGSVWATASPAERGLVTTTAWALLAGAAGAGGGRWIAGARAARGGRPPRRAPGPDELAEDALLDAAEGRA